MRLRASVPVVLPWGYRPAEDRRPVPGPSNPLFLSFPSSIVNYLSYASSLKGLLNRLRPIRGTLCWIGKLDVDGIYLAVAQVGLVVRLS